MVVGGGVWRPTGLWKILLPNAGGAAFMCEPGRGAGAMLTLLGTETGPGAVGATDRDGGGHVDWPMEANGSLLVTGLEK